MFVLRLYNSNISDQEVTFIQHSLHVAPQLLTSVVFRTSNITVCEAFFIYTHCEYCVLKKNFLIFSKKVKKKIKTH